MKVLEIDTKVLEADMEILESSNDKKVSNFGFLFFLDF